VTSDESIDSAVKTVASKVKADGLSLLINNAGVMSVGVSLLIAFNLFFQDKSTHEHPDRQALMNIFNVNVFGTVMNSAKFLTLLQAAGTLERPSKLINLSSIAGSIEHIPDQRLWMMNSSYAMTKAAINSYTTYFAFTEFTNIITAAIHPGIFTLSV
jgi:NAD(P)-dependent dehydrogenase (short-subunit alcohol dehydrogenase family)